MSSFCLFLFGRARKGERGHSVLLIFSLRDCALARILGARMHTGLLYLGSAEVVCVVSCSIGFWGLAAWNGIGERDGRFARARRGWIVVYEEQREKRSRVVLYDQY